jgi:transcriptional regulator with XRE-family HTH domain
MCKPTVKARKQINLSYSELFDLTGIDRATWSRYFNAKQNPTWETLEAIARSLDLDFLECIVAFLERRQETLARRDCRSS